MKDGITVGINKEGVKPVAAKTNTKEMAITAVFIALTFVFTALLNVQFPATMGGLIHLGNIPLLVAAMLYGKRCAAICGGVGMAAYDLMSNWAIYAPCTLIDVALMGYVAGLICSKSSKTRTRAIAIIVASIIKVVGYYVYEIFLFKSFIVPLGSVPGNLMQVLVAGAIVMAIITPLEKQVKHVR